MTLPPVGTIGVTATIGGFHDFVPHAIQRLTGSPVNHAVTLVGDDGTIVEAEGGGVHLANAAKYPNIVWLTELHDDDGHLLQPTTAQLEAAAGFARGMVGTPYNFLDYVALAEAQHAFAGITHFDVENPPRWAVRIADDGRLVCSQQCDLAYSRAGIHLFNHRIPGLVSPGDIWRAGGAPA